MRPKVIVSLRFGGSDLDPDELTRSLGVEPTSAHRQGDPKYSDPAVRRKIRNGRISAWSSGLWSFESGLPQAEPLEAHMRHVLDRLIGKEEQLRELSRRYSADFFRGVFMDSVNSEIVLSPAGLLEIGSLGLELGLDLYS